MIVELRPDFAYGGLGGAYGGLRGPTGYSSYAVLRLLYAYLRLSYGLQFLTLMTVCACL